MKNLIFLSIVMFSFYLDAQTFQDDLLSERTPTQQEYEEYSLSPKVETDEEAFEKAFDEHGILWRTFKNLEGTTEGYYAIIGVFSESTKLSKQVKKLNKRGFDSGYLLNPETKLNYLYINKYDLWQDALADFSTDFNGLFTENVWVLNIANDRIDEQILTVDEVDYRQLQNDKVKNAIGDNEQTKNVESKVSNSTKKNKLIRRADQYFEKMWYAEAAKLYEQALMDNESNYSFEVLQKAGDSYYFLTNMEQAYKWYSILHEKYGEEMSANNIFKYAHSLKGTKNYTRSKKLMKLYNKRLKMEGRSALDVNSSFKTNDIVLDDILNAPKKYDVKNLSVNTKYSEFSPMFYNEDEVVFSSSMDSSLSNNKKYRWNGQPYLELYTAKLNEDSSELKDAIKFSEKINTKYHEASVTFSPDYETIYFTRNNYGKKLKRDDKGINHLKIYQSKKIDGEWAEASEVSFNSDDYSTGHPALSKDGKHLYFVSDMPGSIGDTDIFVVDILEDGSLSSPRNLGPKINTEQKEMFPFVNDEKLYFSSNGHTGLGGLDIYEVAFDDKKFLEVRNLGMPINSNKDDFSFIINADAQKGFFASNREGGKGDDDIYSFKKLEVEETPENLNTITGVITELVTGDIMPMALVELLDENNIKLKETETSEDGSFIFEDLDANTNYTLKTTKETYAEDERNAATKDNQIVNVDVSLRRLNEMISVEDGIRKLKTEMIHFDFDRSYIREDAGDELNKLVSVMKEYPNMVIKIESHTDSRGSAVYNKYLSDKRAKSTRDYIVSQGIDIYRIESAEGYGEEMLLNDCNGTVHCSEENHFQNRRSEFIIVNM